MGDHFLRRNIGTIETKVLNWIEETAEGPGGTCAKLVEVQPCADVGSFGVEDVLRRFDTGELAIGGTLFAVVFRKKGCQKNAPPRQIPSQLRKWERPCYYRPWVASRCSNGVIRVVPRCRQRPRVRPHRAEGSKHCQQFSTNACYPWCITSSQSLE